jgi:hypothetical protein
MRAVLDTNILVSSLPVQLGRPAAIYRLAGGAFYASDRFTWGRSATLDGFAYDGAEWVSMKHC